MSLTTRLTAFFLAALALVLTVSGIGVCAMTATYLDRQADDRLTGTLDALAAAAEVKPGGVEWEPREHHLAMGEDDDEDRVRWQVRDGRGVQVGASRNLGDADLSNERSWRTRSRLILGRAGLADAEVDETDNASHLHDQLIPTAGLSPRPAQAALRNLARIVAGASAAGWLLAALLGHWICRRALAPIRRMAAAAADIGAADLSRRLEAAGTHDELDDLAAAWNGLLGRLEAAFERQRRFTGDAAHQLATPLTALLGHLEVALRRHRPSEDYRAALEESHERAARLRQIVDALLFLARPDADAAAPAPVRMELVHWLPAHLKRWSGQPREEDLQLDLQASSAPVEAAPALLGQLLDNLLDNACKYSAPLTPIIIKLSAATDGVLLQVEDNGVGIPATDLPHIFEPFYRSPEARRLGKPGVGLGLSVARRLATVLGGTLGAQSEAGRGSRFTLRLPALDARCLE